MGADGHFGHTNFLEERRHDQANYGPGPLSEAFHPLFV